MFVTSTAVGCTTTHHPCCNVEGITVVDTLRFYPYRATFDFECFFDGKNLSDRVQWIARHVPLSVSLDSNVPGHESPPCYITDGDSDKLVGSMMSDLSTISDAAFDMLIPSYDNVLNELEARKEAWDEAERKALKEDESKQENDDEQDMGEVETNHYKTLIGQLLGWLHQLPVIGFNSGKYDLNVIKQLFVPYLLTNILTKKKMMMMMTRPDSSLNDRTHSYVSRRRNLNFSTSPTT